MDLPLISDGSFSTANPSLSEIWPFTCGGSGSGDYGGGLVALRMGTDGFINGLIDGIVNGSGGGGGVCGMMNRDGSIEKSTVTGQSGSFGGGDNGNDCGEIGRKMRENVSEDESSKLVSTTSSGNESKESNVKRVKTSNSSKENGSSKAEVETSSAGGKKCAEKQAEPPKDYIHVRARRGQATDSHSLAERARRQKISERMKILQDLVPGCSKVIGKALVLDEIINYIQSLQRQVEFLSMKLEAVTSGMIPSINGFHSKEVNQLALPPFDASRMMVGVQAESKSAAAGGASAGAQAEWLHMQLGGSFE